MRCWPGRPPREHVQGCLDGSHERRRCRPRDRLAAGAARIQPATAQARRLRCVPGHHRWHRAELSRQPGDGAGHRTARVRRLRADVQLGQHAGGDRAGRPGHQHDPAAAVLHPRGRMGQGARPAAGHRHDRAGHQLLHRAWWLRGGVPDRRESECELAAHLLHRLRDAAGVDPAAAERRLAPGVQATGGQRAVPDAGPSVAADRVAGRAGVDRARDRCAVGGGRVAGGGGAGTGRLGAAPAAQLAGRRRPRTKSAAGWSSARRCRCCRSSWFPAAVWMCSSWAR